MRRATLFLLSLLALPLAGCDLLGIESASAVAARRDAEGKAIGGACRHAARSIEQCYAANRKADKAAIFAGWREMNDYMRENKIEAMPESSEAPVAASGDEGGEAAEGPERKAGPAGASSKPGKAEVARTAAAKPATTGKATP